MERAYELETGDENGNLFSESSILLSQINETKSLMTLVWQKWEPCTVEIKKNGMLTTRKDSQSPKHDKPVIIDLKGQVSMTLMEDNIHDAVTSSRLSIEKEVGVVVKVKTDGNEQRVFRLILSNVNFTSFNDAIMKVATSNNINEVVQNSTYLSKRHKDAATSITPSEGSKNTQSIMRKAIMSAMDKYDKRTVKEKVLVKRGALLWLPVFWRNDLIHGSFWFFVGSLLFMASAIIIAINGFGGHDEQRGFLGNDDSILETTAYEASWVLMAISGFFFTIGSIAFMRAVHEDPPMKPLFTWYHFQSDELLGSWLFLLGTLPFIPYCLIYLSASHGESIYLGALVCTAMGTVGTGLFVRGCYPTDKPRMQILQPIFHCMLHCCCLPEFYKKHFANDWLVGCWLILFGAVIATIGSFFILIYYLVEHNSLMLFVFLTALFYNFAFAVGSAYFVAGSYEDEPQDLPPTNAQTDAIQTPLVQHGQGHDL